MRIYVITILSFFLVISALAKDNQKTKSASSERNIIVDINREKGILNTMPIECIGAGRANEGLRADWQQQLAFVKKECDFKYIRMHGLLTDDMGIYKEDENGNPEFNYQYVDVLYDYILSIGMKPFVEFGFMPEALASGKQTIFWWKGNVTPPKDYDKWGNLIKDITKHWTDRYGADEVKTWYFEVWNEPNLHGFWSGTQEEYFKLYQYSVNAIKSVNETYRVGGPATAGAAWETEMIDFCNKNSLPLDFVSTHSYGVKQGYLDEYGQTGTVLDKNPMSVCGDVLQSRKEISNSPKPNLELHYTEWSSSYTPKDPMHDSYHQAAYILEKLKQVGDAATSMSYWVFTDIFEESGIRFTPFHGGFGLLNTQGIKKPVFYTYKFINELGSTELANNDSRSWACKDDKGNIQLLMWDFTNTHPGDSVNNQEYYVRDLPAKNKGKVKIDLSGLTKGIYSIEMYKVGYRANDAYTAYIDMGRPKQLTIPQVDQIKKMTNGSATSIEIVKVKADGKFEREMNIRENDVFLLKMIKL